MIQRDIVNIPNGGFMKKLKEFFYLIFDKYLYTFVSFVVAMVIVSILVF